MQQKTKISSSKGQLNFSSKSARTTNVHLMESHLDDWLKNNHITVDICYLRSLLVPGGFTRFSLSKLFLQSRQASKEQRDSGIKKN